MIQGNLYDLDQPWLVQEKGGLLGSGEHDGGRFNLRETPRQLISKVLSHSTRAVAYRRGKRLAYCLVPSLLRSYLWNEIQPKPKQFPTSYLTGLRGVAAIKVFTFHYLHFFSDSTFVPWGRDDRHRGILQMPIIQFLYSGTTAQVFFIVAGYLMTLQLAKLFDNHDVPSRSKAFLNISGALFRRWFRLYLPTFVITLITAHYIYFGLYERNRNFYNDRDKYFPGPWTEPMPVQYSSYTGQMRNWAEDMWGLCHVWARSYRPQHDVHLWSILVEMQGSLVLYLILMATAQCRKYVRLFAMCMMTVLALFWDHGETWMYACGGVVALSELLLTEWERERGISLPTSASSPIPPPPSAAAMTATAASEGTSSSLKAKCHFFFWSHFGTPAATVWTCIRLFCYLCAFWAISYPMWAYGFYGWDPTAPGYLTLNKFVPRNMQQKERFWPCVGTTLFLFILVRSNPTTSVWRRLLNSDVAQYLGKISFGFYLVHGPLLHAVVYPVPHWVWWSIFRVEGIDSGNFAWTVGILVGWCAGLALCLWMADVWQREIEARTVTVAQKIEKWCFVKTS